MPKRVRIYFCDFWPDFDRLLDSLAAANTFRPDYSSVDRRDTIAQQRNGNCRPGPICRGR